jgi:hypothetical protein
MNNHKNTFVKYDALVAGSSSQTEQLVSDMEDWTTKAVSIDFHQRSMSELEGNMRMHMRLLENKINSQEESIRRMLENQSAMELEQR